MNNLKRVETISRSTALKILKDAGCSKDVIEHCIFVSELATEIARKHPSGPDIELVEIGALLHDLGRSRTHGITHAIEGAAIAERLGLGPLITNIIKRHIGAGICPEEAREFGLPEDDYIPRTLEEKIVAHADNLVSGTRRIGLEERIAQMKKKNINADAIMRVRLLADELDN